MVGRHDAEAARREESVHSARKGFPERRIRTVGARVRDGIHERSLEMRRNGPRQHVNDGDAEGFDFGAQRIGDGLDGEFGCVIGPAELTLTMRPFPARRIAGKTSCESRIPPKTLVSNCRRMSSSDISSIGPYWP